MVAGSTQAASTRADATTKTRIENSRRCMVLPGALRNPVGNRTRKRPEKINQESMIITVRAETAFKPIFSNGFLRVLFRPAKGLRLPALAVATAPILPLGQLPF